MSFKQRQALAIDQNYLVAKRFYSSVFLWMVIAIAATATTAYIVNTNEEIHNLFFDDTSSRPKLLGFIVILAPFVIASLLHYTHYKRLPKALSILLFMSFAVLIGITISTIFSKVPVTTILSAFVGAAVIFIVMAVMGFTTDKDLSKLGPILYSGLIALLLVTCINILVNSIDFNLLASYLGITIFTGLIAYDVQKVKNLELEIPTDQINIITIDPQKVAIVHALNLYISFANIFNYLLQIFSGKR
uniref:Bax inhibitor-1/YccA family protein n=1 Tax=Pedobacter schmidteae TaxID=2201271 RepID=UPI000EB0AE70|nr:Bax inhibitor-1/YccA family protein [Pedobacter schmidteae]